MKSIRHASPLTSPSTTCLCLFRARPSSQSITDLSTTHQNSPSNSHCQFQSHRHSQIRHATFIPRPRRPYTFTQLVTLSDGSTYLHRTSSPAPVLKSTKDTRNSQLWNPSSQRLMNVEADEAGRLRSFRSRFGRGWDSKRGNEIEVDAEGIEVGEEVEVLETVVPKAVSADDTGVSASPPPESPEAAGQELGGGSDGQGEVQGKNVQEVVVDSVEIKTDSSRKEYKDQDEVEDDNFLDLISSSEFDSGVALGPKDKKKKKGKGKK